MLGTAGGFTANADWKAAVKLLAAGQAVTALGGVGITPAHELRTQPSVWWLIGLGSTGMPAQAASRVDREDVNRAQFQQNVAPPPLP